MSCIVDGFLQPEAPGKPTLVDRLLDTGNQTQTRRPLPGWANSHSLDEGEETKRAIIAANPVFNCPWIYCGSGQEGSSPGYQFSG